MAVSTAQTGESLHSSTFASRYVRTALPRFKIPEQSIPKEAAYQIINDELMLDCNPRLNLASFVTTWMEPECDKLMMDSINKNYVNMDEYPVTTELQNRCVNMIAHLFNAPIGDDETAIGVGTVGSSEAIMLAGLAFKRRWQNRRKAEGKPYDKPNIVTGANVQVCWEKFARYFEVELKEVKLTEGYYVMNPEKAVEMVDENTICVAAILGSTLTGEFEDVKMLNDLLKAKNAETGWDTPIHVDAASGGFIAPFIYPELEWDFRLPLVKSINVSGHKYGLVYAGVGWVIWRTKDDLPDELIFHINYLGADQPTFTLNFSKGSNQIIGQYYQLIRLGFECANLTFLLAEFTCVKPHSQRNEDRPRCICFHPTMNDHCHSGEGEAATVTGVVAVVGPFDGRWPRRPSVGHHGHAIPRRRTSSAVVHATPPSRATPPQCRRRQTLQWPSARAAPPQTTVARAFPPPPPPPPPQAAAATPSCVTALASQATPPLRRPCQRRIL
ncbi:hypothetical protein ABZP36_003540 [Zizania latifolia]